MKTFILALAISLAPLVDSGGIDVQSARGKDQSGLSAQIDRILSTKKWPSGEVELTFKLDDMHLIRVHDVESKNLELAEDVADYLQKKEVFPKLGNNQDLYEFNISFGKKQKRTFLN